MSTVYHGTTPNNPNGSNTPTQNTSARARTVADMVKDANIRRTLINAATTDAGNADCFVLLHKDKLRYCKTRKQWMMWDGFVWKNDADGFAQRAAIATARARKSAAHNVASKAEREELRDWAKTTESIARRNAMLNTAMHDEQIETNIEMFDRNPFLVATKNGTIDLTTGNFREARREDYISMQLNAFYDANAKAPKWEKFLKEVFSGDEELISYIQKAVGYTLTGDTSEQVIFICFGNGANGKSVFLDVLYYLLGDYAANCAFSTFEANNRNQATNDLAALKGKRYVPVIETDEDKRLAEARVKSITGQDPISCRFLFREFFSYVPEFKIWMAVNYKPMIRGTDRGIWRRVRAIPFNQNFEANPNPYLAAELKEEAAGILNWMLEGVKKWQQERLGTAKAIQEASDEYRKESDLLQQWIDEQVELDANATTPSYDAYSSFVQWCTHRGYPRWSSNSFGRAMTEKGFVRKSNGKTREYVGLKAEAYVYATP
jgi:putative DNA primase/helicase